MVTYRHLINALRQLGLDHSRPVIAHVSLSSFGEVQGGEKTMVGALLTVVKELIMPVFTYKTMLIPETGPADNGITYGGGRDKNNMAEFFDPQLPADRLMGVVAEALRQHPEANRSMHPILSFAGVNADHALYSQTIEEPLVPIRVFTEAEGWVLLLGVDHTGNTSIHHGEQLAGRNKLIRWALTPQGVQECPNFPNCSRGFQSLEPRLNSVTRKVQVGKTEIKAIPLPDLVEHVQSWIAEDPQALLCEYKECERCNAVRI